jgi:hypothetical protein
MKSNDFFGFHPESFWELTTFRMFPEQELNLGLQNYNISSISERSISFF